MKKFLLMSMIALLMVTGLTMAEPEDKYVVDGEETILVDNDFVKIYLTGDYSITDYCNRIRGNYMTDLICVVENKSDETIEEVGYYATINGWSLKYKHGMNNASNITPGAKIESYIWFTTEDTLVTTFDELDTIALTLVIETESGSTFEEKTGLLHFHASNEAMAEPEKTAGISSDEAQTVNEPIIIYGTYETLENGSKGNEVKQLQQALIDQGFLTGNADGIFGNGTAASVKAFQESVNLEPTGIADGKTQAELFGGIDVRPALMKETWYVNGGSDTTMNILQFSENTVKISQIVYDAKNGRHPNAGNDYPYILNKEGITITLIDGSELKISFAASGNRLILNDHEYWSATEVDEGLQGYWKYREREMTLWGVYVEREEHVYLGDGMMKYEFATEGINLNKGEYYYYGPYEASYTLGLACFETDLSHGGDFSFNIIDNIPVLLYDKKVFERTEEKFPGKQGYKF